MLKRTGLVATGAVVATSLGSGEAQAADGDPIRVGNGVSGTSPTTLVAGINGNVALQVLNSAGTSSASDTATIAVLGSGSDVGVFGVGESVAGVMGIFPDSTSAFSQVPGAVVGLATQGYDGVRGQSDTGTGVYGQVPAGGAYGVHGNCQEPSGVGVFGDGAYGAAGVYGHTGSGNGVQGIANEGVAVLALALGAGNTAGTGLHAKHNSGGLALLADSTGDAVHATTTVGTAVLATATTGFALKSNGKASFAGVTQFALSGVLTVAAGAKTVTKPNVVNLTASTLVLATLQQHAGATTVASAVPNVAAKSFTVSLTAPAPAGGLKVAWFLVN